MKQKDDRRWSKTQLFCCRHHRSFGSSVAPFVFAFSDRGDTVAVGSPDTSVDAFDFENVGGQAGVYESVILSVWTFSDRVAWW